MSNIKVLDEKTINKIAAGEVVEKPASIIKELVENSIDSGADEINVEVRNGGITYIKVCDNGSGIHYDDLETAFLRHATSKIRTEDDLNTIVTLGFRGEALASIAAVSKVEMISKTKENDIGAKILIEGGKILSKEYCGSPTGTIITVQDVFFNTPARLKFLKSQRSEGMYITETMQNLAMSHTDISFKYRLNDKLIFATRGDGDLKSVLLAIYGREIVNNLIKLEYSGSIAAIKGYIGNSSIAKGSRSGQSVFVNRRYIKNKVVAAAAEAAYKSMLTINKYPFFVIEMFLNPELVDVNVHPSKSEIKFQDDNAVFKDVYNAVKNALLSENIIPDIKESKSEIIKDIPKINYEQQKMIFDDTEKIKESTEKCYIDSYEKIENNFQDEKNKEVLKKEVIEGNNKFNAENITNLKEPKIEPLSIIGQMNFTYIIAEGENDLYIIDQHAAHERIYYEKYLREYNDSKIHSQNIAVPIIMNLSISEKQLVLENIDFFNKFGYQLEDFGGNSISIRAVPVIYGNPNFKELFNEIVSILNNRENQRINVIDRILFTLSCKSAVKSGDKLNYKEMHELIENLRYCESPFTCPHGRPTIIKMTFNELEKRFKRIQ